jgi:hypothetical protein
MSRKRKMILNQKFEESNVEKEIIEEPMVEEELPEESEIFYNSSIVDELEEAVAEELEEAVVEEVEESVVEPAPEEEQAIVFTNEPIEIEIPEKPEPRTLTVKEHKRFLRTGKLPF